jgi:hypothetical protein
VRLGNRFAVFAHAVQMKLDGLTIEEGKCRRVTGVLMLLASGIFAALEYAAHQANGSVLTDKQPIL